MDSSVTVGLLHPGAMGAAVGRCLRGVGVPVVWASDGRGADTRGRADEAGLTDVGSVDALVEASDVVLSVCPPDAAVEVARLARRHTGIYVDANAVAPVTMAEVAAALPEARVVDGGIIGLPPRPGRGTRLYLAGDGADEVAPLWAGSDLEVLVLPGPLGAASALKMAYAGWTKGSAALLLTMRAAAREAGVEDALVAEWGHSLPDLPARHDAALASAREKGWRWVGEMEQIAQFLRSQGQPGGALDAAADVYRAFPR